MYQQNMVIDGDYEINRSIILGRGSQGIVHPCLSRGQQHLSLCAKIIDAKYNGVNIKQEIDILNLLKDRANNNPNVVKVYLVKLLQNEIIIIMERCEKDMKALWLQQKSFSVIQLMDILKQLVNGYRICYENSILHRDIKPENVLVLNGQYKLTDFGVGKILEQQGGIQLMMTIVGTPVFQAPQLLLGLNQFTTSKVDVYSLGLVMYCLLFGSPPFIINDKSMLQQQVMNLKYNPIKISPNCVFGMTPEFACLIESMVRFEEADRISWEQLFAHPLIKVKPSIPIQLRQLLQNHQPSIKKMASLQLQSKSPIHLVPTQPIILQSMNQNQFINQHPQNTPKTPSSTNQIIIQVEQIEVEPIQIHKLRLTSEDEIIYQQLIENNRLETIKSFNVNQQIWDILNWFYKFTAEFEEYSYTNKQFKNDFNIGILLLKGLITSLATNLHNQTTNHQCARRFQEATGKVLSIQQDPYLIYEILNTSVHNYLFTMGDHQFVTKEFRETALIKQISIKIQLDSDIYLTYFLALFQNNFDEFFPFSPSNNYSLRYLQFQAMLKRLVRREYTLDDVNRWPSVEFSEYNISSNEELRRIISNN